MIANGNAFSVDLATNLKQFSCLVRKVEEENSQNHKELAHLSKKTIALENWREYEHTASFPSYLTEQKPNLKIKCIYGNFSETSQKTHKPYEEFYNNSQCSGDHKHWFENCKVSYSNSEKFKDSQFRPAAIHKDCNLTYFKPPVIVDCTSFKVSDVSTLTVKNVSDYSNTETEQHTKDLKLSPDIWLESQKNKKQLKKCKKCNFYLFL